MSPRTTRARRARKAPRTIWLAAGAVVLAGTGVTAVAVTTGSGSTGTGDNSRPAKAHTLALDGKDTKKRELPRTETQLFSLVGVSWDDSADDFEGTAQIRTRSAESGTWTDWHDLDFDIRAPETDEGDASEVRGASEPLWVGPSDAVEARVVADGKESAVPKALRLDMIDPGETKGGKGNNGKGKPSSKPKKTTTATPSPTGSSGDTAPSTTPEPSSPASEPAGTPVTEEPVSPSAPAPSQEPTQEPSAPAPSQEPTAEPSSPSQEPTPPAPSAEPTQEPTQEPQEPTAEPSAPAPAPSEEPTAEPSASAPADEPTAQPSTSEPAPDTSTTGPATPAVPAIVSRAEWGADESLVADPPSYLDKVDAVFVHHTAGTNDYACADSPAIVRAILTYHVKTNGWNDIGYNFFVDKCGTVFEGRAGGVDKPVRGAHTYGFNGYSSGVSLLGDYENGGTPTAAAKRAIADISAWKLGLHGVDPEAKVTLTAAGDTGVYKTGEQATLNTISGHRDGFATLCPGATLYSALPEIRRTAGASVYATR